MQVKNQCVRLVGGKEKLSKIHWESVVSIKKEVCMGSSGWVKEDLR